MRCLGDSFQTRYEPVFDSRVAADGSVEEDQDVAKGFFWKEGVDLDEILDLVARGFP